MVYSSDRSDTVGKQYSFPSVSINEKVIGPANFNADWRNTIGVAGVFSRGPSKAFISSRQDFVTLFGEDDSSGSLAVTQAMQQGATNFVISRVLPLATAASGSISLSADGLDALIKEAEVAEGDEKTIGVEFNLTGVLPALKTPGAYLGYGKSTDNENYELRVASSLNSSINLDYNGRGSFQFTILERVNNISQTLSNDIKVNVVTTSTNDKIQLVTVTDTDSITLVEEKLKVGNTLEISSNSLAILTASFKINETTLGFYAQGLLSSGNAGSNKTAKIKSAAGSDYYILGYNFLGASASTLSESISTQEYNKYGNYLGFITMSSSNPTTVTYIKLIKKDTSGNLYSEHSTNIGILFTIQNKTLSSFVLLPKSDNTFSVGFVNSTILVGGKNSQSGNAFKAGTTAFQILQQLKDELLSNSDLNGIVDDAVVNTSYLPYSLSFRLFNGEGGNNLKYSLKKYVSSGSPTDINVSPTDSNALALVGGSNGSRPAELFLYDDTSAPLVYIEAVSSGSAGNNIKVTVTPNTNGEFGIEISYLDLKDKSVRPPAESFILNNYSTDPKSGVYLDTLDSKLIRAYFIPLVQSQISNSKVEEVVYTKVPNRVAPANKDETTLTNVGHPQYRGALNLKNLSLVNGFQPDIVASDSAISQAIEALEEEDVFVVIAPDVIAGDPRYTKSIDTLINQVSNATPFNGLRFGVLQTPPRLSAGKAEVLAKTYSNKKLILISGYNTLTGKSYLGTNTVSPVGTYAGVLAVNQPSVSPAGISNVQGISLVETPSKLDFLDKLTRSRIEVLHLDPVMGVIKFLNGRTSSNNPDNKWVSIIRISDHLIMKLFQNLQWAKGQSNTQQFRTRVASSCDAFMESTKLSGIIQGYTATICNETNNTQEDIARGRLNIAISYVPVFPSDYINVNLTRTYSNEFSISLN